MSGWIAAALLAAAPAPTCNALPGAEAVQLAEVLDADGRFHEGRGLASGAA